MAPLDYVVQLYVLCFCRDKNLVEHWGGLARDLKGALPLALLRSLLSRGLCGCATADTCPCLTASCSDNQKNRIHKFVTSSLKARKHCRKQEPIRSWGTVLCHVLFRLPSATGLHVRTNARFSITVRCAAAMPPPRAECSAL